MDPSQYTCWRNLGTGVIHLNTSEGFSAWNDGNAIEFKKVRLRSSYSSANDRPSLGCKVLRTN